MHNYLINIHRLIFNGYVSVQSRFDFPWYVIEYTVMACVIFFLIDAPPRIATENVRYQICFYTTLSRTPNDNVMNSLREDLARMANVYPNQLTWFVVNLTHSHTPLRSYTYFSMYI
jgi:hypothetical protein